MIVKLALANVKRSYKDFAIYFFTLMFGVAVFYAFNTITVQETAIQLSKAQGNIIELLGVLIDGVSVFIAFILAFLVIYASRFLIKRRNREFAVYLLLGMPKSTVLRITLVETLFVGAVSLAIGLLLGFVLSQVLMQVTAALFVAEIPGFSLLFVPEVAVKTALVFLAIFVVALFFNVGYVMRAKLIDLILNERKNDDMKLRNLPLAFVLFIVSCALIACAYYLLLENGLVVNERFLLSTVLVCVGTLLFFYSLSGFLLRLIQMIKPIYFRGLNMFTLRQVASRINSSFVSMSVICMTLFLAITSVCGGIGICNALQSGYDQQTRYSATVTSYHSDAEVRADDSPDQGGDFDMARALSEEAQKRGSTSWDSLVRESAQIDTYASTVTFGDLDALAEKPLSSYNSSVNDVYQEQPLGMVKLSQYNRALELAGHEPITLGQNEGMISADANVVEDYLRSVLRNPTTLEVFGSPIHLRGELDTTCLETTSIPMQVGLLVVNDEVIPTDAHCTISKLNVQYVDAGAEEPWQDMMHSIFSTFSDEGEDRLFSTYMTKQEVYDQGVGLSTVVSYLAIYIGFVLVVACAAILAIQQLTGVSDNVRRYRLLHKLGATPRMIDGALFKQILIAFLFPLLLGVAHSVCAMNSVVSVVSFFGHLDIGQMAFITAGVFLLVYGTYFAITYLCARNMIRRDDH